MRSLLWQTGCRRVDVALHGELLAPPTDAGHLGNVDGGRVLEWIDKAGYACAVGWSGTYSVTAYVGNVRFSQPVRVGHLVQATARLVNTGRSSMQVLSPWNQVQSRTGSCPRQPNA